MDNPENCYLCLKCSFVDSQNKSEWDKRGEIIDGQKRTDRCIFLNLFFDRLTSILKTNSVVYNPPHDKVPNLR